jgi:hypothetical protein
MARERPWMKFYPADWRADPMLRVCSIGARGLWVEMLALMHESERYGRLLVNGEKPTDADLAALTGVPLDVMVPLIAELEKRGVFSRDSDGIIYSRRMKRDEKKAEIARKTGKRGGNPKLLEQKEIPASDNGGDKRTDNGGLKAHMPEAREERTTDVVPKKTRLDEDWEPDQFGPKTESRAIIDAWSPDEYRRQLEAFKAHHAANGSRFEKWQQAWSTWVINSRQFNRGRQQQPQPSSAVGSDYLATIAKEVEEGRWQ